MADAKIPRLQWDDNLITGVKQLDQQHRQLIATANRLLEAIEQEATHAMISQKFTALAEFFKIHLACEEALLRLADYGEFAPHMAVHDSMRTVVADLQTRFDAGEAPSTELVNFLDFWFLDHIANNDTQYGDAVAATLATEQWDCWFETGQEG